MKYVAKKRVGARKNPIQYSIGTMSSKDKKGYDDLYQPCIKILNGDVEVDEMFILFFQQGDECEILEPSSWRKSNQSLELMGNEKEVIKEYERTKIFLPTFRRSIFALINAS